MVSFEKVWQGIPCQIFSNINFVSEQTLSVNTMHRQKGCPNDVSHDG
jgi:hypothetical protein